MYKPTDFTQSEPVNFYYYPKDDSAEEFEPPSEDEGVDTSEMIENDEESDVVPMLQIDPRTSPCNEDYDNYDSERILQIDESIEEEAEESGILKYDYAFENNVYLRGFQIDLVLSLSSCHEKEIK